MLKKLFFTIALCGISVCSAASFEELESQIEAGECGVASQITNKILADTGSAIQGMQLIKKLQESLISRDVFMGNAFAFMGCL